MWVSEQDIYNDQLFWQHKITKQISLNEPTIFHYLPPNFIIPEPPEPLPEDIDLQSSSSSNESLTDWQAKYGNQRRALKAKELTLNKAKKNSMIRSNAQMREKNAKKRASMANSSWAASSSNTVASPSASLPLDQTYNQESYYADEGYAAGGEDPYYQHQQQQQYYSPDQQQYYSQDPQYQQQQQYYGNFPPDPNAGTMMQPVEQTWSLPHINNPYSHQQQYNQQGYPEQMYGQGNDPYNQQYNQYEYNQYGQENYYPPQQEAYFPAGYQSNEGYETQSVTPSVQPSICPDDLNSVTRQVTARAVDEYELAYKAIRKVRLFLFLFFISL